MPLQANVGSQQATKPGQPQLATFYRVQQDSVPGQSRPAAGPVG